jgi:hypothetical protein
MAGPTFFPRTFETYLAQATRTSHPTAVAVEQTSYRGVKFYIDITALTGTSLTFTIQAVDPVNGTLSTVLASAAKTGTGAFTLTVAPDATTVANVALSDYAPMKWQITVTGTFTSAAYHISYQKLA